jgi:monofunctional biosynthetic peptidoglycan transglycosylase
MSTASPLRTFIWPFIKRLGFWLLMALLGLQLFFLARIVSWRWINPASTSFERTQFFQQVATAPFLSFSPLSSKAVTGNWQQTWVDLAHISVYVQQAVIASEDAHFAEHDGVDWDALEKAWERNEAAQQLQQTQQTQKNQPAHSGKFPMKPTKPMKWQGGSTLTQQVAKNLFLSGERSFIRKAQELVLTFMLEACLSKERILEIYLNHAEWGQGIFGIEAAAQVYHHIHASQLSRQQAARLVVMLPRPRYYQQHPSSPYLQKRTQAILRRMPSAVLPGVLS